MATSDDHNSASVHKLQCLQIDSLLLAVPDSRVTTIIPWTIPAALPFAPQPVLGIVCVEGRMFTVLDAAALVQGDSYVPQGERSSLIVLKGDEQLALAADGVDECIEVRGNEIKPPTEAVMSLATGLVSRNGSEIIVLNPNSLFPLAMRGRERRRRRT